jgi:hypothetical protein
MTTKLSIRLNENEFSSLYQLARAELRAPSEQARYMLRVELARRGLLPEPEQPVADVAGREVDCEPA